MQWLLGGEVIGYAPRQEEAVGETRDKKSRQEVAIIAQHPREIPIISTIAAGGWREYDAVSQAPIGTLSIGNGALFAVKAEGTSMNTVAADGDIVLIKPWSEVHRDLRNGDIVAIKRSRGDLFELTLKLHRDGMLHCQSTDPKWASTKFPLNDGDQIEVVGLAVGIYKSL